MTDGERRAGDIIPRHLCHVATLGYETRWNSRFMCDKPQDRWDEVERRLQNFVSWLSESDTAFDRTDQSLMATQSSLVAIGRVVCDAEAEAGAKLNPSSVIFEGCAKPCRGLRVHLDLRNLPYFSLFPGQTLAVYGENPSGHCLVASKIVDFLPPPALPVPHLPAKSQRAVKKRKTGSHKPANKQEEQMTEDENLFQGLIQDYVDDKDLPMANEATKAQTSGEEDTSSEEHDEDPVDGLRMIIAAGPFTSSTSWSFRPLEDLLRLAKERPVHLLLLIGPFIDAEHPELQQGLLDRDMDEIFRTEVVERIERFCQETGEGCRVGIMPSIRDAHHTLIYPQAAFPSTLFQSCAPQVSCLANPCTFTVDQHLAVACTSADILKSLIKEEAARVPPSAPSDRMLRLAGHIIGQRCFFPLFPPPLGSCLDLSVAPTALDLPVLPHLLLLPSDLVPFVKVLKMDAQSSVDSSAKDDPQVTDDLKGVSPANTPMQRHGIAGAETEDAATADGAPAAPPAPQGAEAQPDQPQTASGASAVPVGAGAAQVQQATRYDPVVVNPGRLAKGTVGGTFAEVEIRGGQNGWQQHNITVNIRKLNS